MILVIPDVHNKVEQFNKIMAKFSHIKTKVSLGDWHDSFEWPVGPQIEETARVQADFISNPDHTCLMGNHDIQYAFPDFKGMGIMCSGHGFWKQEPIDKWMKSEWSKVKLFQWLTINDKDFLLSHAGVHAQFAHPILGLTEEHVYALCTEAMAAVRYESRVTPILSIGRRRGGWDPVGGITWCDWRDFEPTDGVNQICGHTINFDVRQRNTLNSANFCIDTNLNHVAIIDDDGEVIIENV
jgi:hypothetical protein